MNMKLQQLKKLLLTPVGTRFSKTSPNKIRGVALVMVMISIALMSGIIADMGYNETVRYRLAIYQRDALKAEALAEGGLNFARLMLVIQGKIQPYFTAFANAGIPLPAFTVWELLPLNSTTLKELSTGELLDSFGLDVSQSLEDRKEKRIPTAPQEKGAAPKKSAFYEKPDGGFGDFDGDFDLDIQDEESKISLRGWTTVDQKRRNATRKLLYALFEPESYDGLFDNRDNPKLKRYDRQTVIANIYDWIDNDKSSIDPYATDADWGRSTSGSENALYDQPGQSKPKNAYFDSFEELRLVKGFTDDHMRAFGPALTIYGEGTKINILSAKKPVIEALVKYCAASLADPLLRGSPWVSETLSKWQEYKSGGLGAVSPQGFLNFLLARELKLNKDDCAAVIGDRSSNFTVKSSATVGDVTRTLTLVARAQGSAPEELYFFTSR